MPAHLTPFQDDLPIPPVVRPFGGTPGHHLTIKARPRSIQLHAQLPPASVWSYRLSEGTVVRYGSGATFLGPTVVVNRGEVVQTRWENLILPTAAQPATLPYEVVKIDSTDPAAGAVPQNLPGSAGALGTAADPQRAKMKNLKAVLVTHLHGGRTQADSDGWPDNTATPGQHAHYTYHNDQSAATLWYHDHANHVTRLNVYAGLAGAWLVRDAEEAALDLPDGDFEVPLVIQDRNLAVDSTSDSFTGALVHKTEVNGGPGEFFGPYTLVNGKIWPRLRVEPRLYRFRLLNGSNARTYRLLLLDEAGAVRHAGAWLIGTDQGLRRTKLSLPTTGLLLAPGERADVLIDFAAFKNHSLYLWNTADAPFGNDPAYAPDVAAEMAALSADPLAGDETEAGRRPFPQVMRLDVAGAASSASHRLPADPLRQSPPWSAGPGPNMPIRLTALVERPAMSPTEGSMLVFWECLAVTPMEPAPAGAAVIDFSYTHPVTGQPVTAQYWKAAEAFYDTLNWKVHLNSTEQWYVVNLSPDTHPVHVHLVDMQVTQRNGFDVYVNGQTVPLAPAPGERTPVVDGNSDVVNRIDMRAPVVIDADQTDAKDTIRVDPGQMVGVAMKFGPYCGHYMVHCHILEHEDHDMMRPFVVVEPSVPHHM